MNKKEKFLKWSLITTGVVLLIIFMWFVISKDYANTWNSWGRQEDNTFVYPDWTYLILICNKLMIYFCLPIFISIGRCIENKKFIMKRKFLYYFITTMNGWFLFLVTIKLILNSVLEADRIFDFKPFESIQDIQLLVGYILTFFLKQNIKLENKVEDKKDLEQF